MRFFSGFVFEMKREDAGLEIEFDPQIVSPWAFERVNEWMENSILKEKDKYAPLSAVVKSEGAKDLSKRLLELFTAQDFLQLDSRFGSEIVKILKEIASEATSEQLIGFLAKLGDHHLKHGEMAQFLGAYKEQLSASFFTAFTDKSVVEHAPIAKILMNQAIKQNQDESGADALFESLAQVYASDDIFALLATTGEEEDLRETYQFVLKRLSKDLPRMLEAGNTEGLTHKTLRDVLVESNFEIGVSSDQLIDLMELLNQSSKD